MKPTIVLETQGKHECVDRAYVHIFDTIEGAEVFCASKRTGHVKHWTHAEIVNAGEKVELMQPEE